MSACRARWMIERYAQAFAYTAPRRHLWRTVARRALVLAVYVDGMERYAAQLVVEARESGREG